MAAEGTGNLQAVAGGRGGNAAWTIFLALEQVRGACSGYVFRPPAEPIQAMCELTGPASATKHTFTPGKLHYTASGLPFTVNAASPNTGGQTMLFQNDAGQFLLFVWNAQVAPGGTVVPATITFPANRTQIVEYNITNSGNNQTPVQTVSAASSITIQLAADVHLLVINY